MFLLIGRDRRVDGSPYLGLAQARVPVRLGLGLGLGLELKDFAGERDDLRAAGRGCAVAVAEAVAIGAIVAEWACRAVRRRSGRGRGK